MEKYIGFKLIQAEPMTRGEYNIYRGWTIPKNENPSDEGFLCSSKDHMNWTPKNVFEKDYMQVGDNNTITQPNVDGFVKDYETFTLGEKTTVVKANLVNGFTIVDSSSCVDISNYDEKIGIEICKDRIKNKIWELLGFLLQTAKEGIK